MTSFFHKITGIVSDTNDSREEDQSQNDDDSSTESEGIKHVDDNIKIISQRLLEHFTKCGRYENEHLVEKSEACTSEIVETPLWELAKVSQKQIDKDWETIESIAKQQISESDWEDWTDWDEIRSYLEDFITEEEWDNWSKVFEESSWRIMLLHDIDHMDGDYSDLVGELSLSKAVTADVFIFYAQSELSNKVKEDQDSPRTPIPAFPPIWSERGFIPHPAIVPVLENVE